MKQNTLQIGALGLARAIYEYQKLGFVVSIPLVDAQDYDLVIEKDGKFYSVQCKTTNRLTRRKDNNHIYDIDLRNIKTNTKCTTTTLKGSYDLLFVLCGNDDCYSIPSYMLPQSGISVGGPKYQQFKLGNESTIGSLSLPAK